MITNQKQRESAQTSSGGKTLSRRLLIRAALGFLLLALLLGQPIGVWFFDGGSIGIDLVPLMIEMIVCEIAFVAGLIRKQPREHEGKTADGRFLLSKDSLFRSSCSRIGRIGNAILLALCAAACFIAAFFNSNYGWANLPNGFLLFLALCALALPALIWLGIRIGRIAGRFRRDEYVLTLSEATGSELRWGMDGEGYPVWSSYMVFADAALPREIRVDAQGKEAREFFVGKLYYLLILDGKIMGSFEELSYVPDAALESMLLVEGDREEMLKNQENLKRNQERSRAAKAR